MAQPCLIKRPSWLCPFFSNIKTSKSYPKVLTFTLLVKCVGKFILISLGEISLWQLFLLTVCYIVLARQCLAFTSMTFWDHFFLSCGQQPVILGKFEMDFKCCRHPYSRKHFLGIQPKCPRICVSVCVYNNPTESQFYNFV